MAAPSVLENEETGHYSKSRDKKGAVSMISEEKEEIDMNRIIMTVVVIFMLSFGLFMAASHGGKTVAEGWSSYQLTNLRNYFVKNHQEQYLGRIQDFVIDSSGRVVFAIISRPGTLGIRGKPVAVPFEALSAGREKNEFVLGVSWEQFASLPNYDRSTELNNAQWAADVYRHFGLQPYWTDEGKTKEKVPHRQEGESQGF
jgi:hypothetical protein